MRFNLFLNGSLESPDALAVFINPNDTNIAVDGGARHCKALGITPSAVIGDFDSITEEEMVRLMEVGVEIITYPKDKDQTDLELALELAVERGAEEIVIYAGLGNRWDMTMANLMVLALPQYHDLKIKFQEADQIIFCIQKTAPIPGDIGDTVSLLPLGADAIGVTTTGLKYPLYEEKLIFAESRGVSNLIKNEKAEVSLQKGFLLCFVTKSNSIS